MADLRNGGPPEWRTQIGGRRPLAEILGQIDLPQSSFGRILELIANIMVVVAAVVVTSAVELQNTSSSI